MKEVRLTSDKIIKTLKKKGCIEIDCICDNCLREVMELVLCNFRYDKKTGKGITFNCCEIGKDLYGLIIEIDKFKWED